MKITADQAAIGETVSRIVMAWIAFLGTMLTTAAFLILLAWCVFTGQRYAATVVVGVVNGFFLNLLRIIYKSIFPNRSQKPGRGSGSKAKGD